MNGVSHTCKNCGQEFSTEYCGHCGQKVVHRLDTRHIIHELFHSFTHTDRGILAFIPMIMLRPGIYARHYVEGKRKSWFNVVQYLVIIVGIVTFLMTKSHYMDNIASSLGADGEGSARVQAVQKQITGFLQRYTNFFLFALLPVFSLFSWLFFRNRKFNYAENFLLQMSIQAMVNTWTLFLIMPFAFILPKEKQAFIIPFSLVLLMICNTVGNRQFFKVSWIQAFFKGLAVYILTNIVQFIIMMIAIVIILLNYKK